MGVTQFPCQLKYWVCFADIFQSGALIIHARGVEVGPNVFGSWENGSRKSGDTVPGQLCERKGSPGEWEGILLPCR